MSMFIEIIVGAISLLFVLLWFPRLLRALSSVLDEIADLARSAIPAVAECAQRVVTLQGECVGDEQHRRSLRPHELVTLLAGSLLMSALCLGVLLFGFTFFSPAISGIFDLPQLTLPANFMDDMAKAMVASVLIVPLIAGIVMTDLAGWGIWTPFALISRGRAGVFKLARATLLLSIFIGVLAGAYRAVIYLEPVLGESTTEIIAAYLAAPVVMLIDPLILVGVFLSAPGLAAVFWVLAVLGAMAVCLALLLLANAARLVSLVCGQIQEGVTGCVAWLKKCFAKRATQLDILVGNADPAATPAIAGPGVVASHAERLEGLGAVRSIQ